MAADADQRPSVASEITPRAAAVGVSAHPVLGDGEAVAAEAAGAAVDAASAVVDAALVAVGGDSNAIGRLGLSHGEVPRRLKPRRF